MGTLPSELWRGLGDGALDRSRRPIAILPIVEFDYDVSEFLGVASVADFPAAVSPGRSYIVVFGRSQHGRREPLLVDALTSRIPQVCDGTRTAAEVADATGPGRETAAANTISWIEDLFLLGLVSLQESRVIVDADDVVQEVS